MKITIFTPTYNRSTLLKRLYNSLISQTCYNFEWIIVDDDSQDDTQEKVKNFSDKFFDIIYLKQSHGGKHRAINRGLDIARGEYFFIVDSDDYLLHNSIELVCKWIDNLDDNLVGVSGLIQSENGTILGGMPIVNAQGYVDASNFERVKYRLNGDKAEIYKTSVMKKHKFPEFENEDFVTEAVCWDKIASEGGKLRWYSTPIYISEYLETGLTKTGANSYTGRIKNFKGYCFYINQCIKIKPSIMAICDFRAYNDTCNKMFLKLHERAKAINLSKMRYLYWLSIKMPFLYSIRILKKIMKIR